MITGYFIPVLLVSLQYVTALLSIKDVTSALETNPNNEEVCEMVRKYNYSCDTHEVITEDKYILNVVHVHGDPSKPVFLQHGFLDSAITWVLREEDSPALWLAKNGYDIWLGNTRGNKYSRAHVTLNPNLLKFWEFSFHEMAIYDVPAMIDYILNETGQTKLQMVAHSQGTSLVYVLASIRPEFASKIKNVLCLAPIAYLDHAQKPFFSILSLAGGPLLSQAVGFIGHGEFLSSSSVLSKTFQLACTQGLIGYAACGLGLASVLFGPDPEQLEPAFAKKAFKYYPAGSSTKNGAHLLQIIMSQKFRQYDYGVRNMEMYNSFEPPVYNLSKIFLNMTFYVGLNDRLSTVKDVERLIRELGLKPKKKFMENFNHIDFIWGKDMSTDLYPSMLEILIKHQ